MKKVLFTQRSDIPHWVGNGFPVRTVFSYNDIAEKISPFLLLDYAGPAEFSSTTERRGVDTHPHRGFETVTLVYDGQVEHRDSAGGGGVIQKGDVQWMTAASGLVHQEFHGKEFAKSGGRFEMVQLWVNLPKKYKMVKPRYQGVLNENIPVIQFNNNQGSLRVIAGEYQGQTGPAKTFSPINVWDISLKAQAEIDLKVPANHTTLVFVMSGELVVSNTHTLTDADLAVLETVGDNVHLKANKDTKLVFLGGEPLNEPIVGYGPFVMSHESEIMQAFKDFQDGKMGVIENIEGSD